jgi:hypothetical protein
VGSAAWAQQRNRSVDGDYAGSVSGSAGAVQCGLGY